jgi:outer membrane protein TolC
MTWEDCIAAAIEKNPSLRAAAEQVKQKKHDTAIAVSPLLPQSSVSVQGGQTETGGNESRNASISVGVRQLLFDGLKSYYDITPQR